MSPWAWGELIPGPDSLLSLMQECSLAYFYGCAVGKEGGQRCTA